jgi:hypothetical protein
VCLEESNWLAHGALNGQRLDVLPVLLEQRDQKVDGGNKVGGQVSFVHLQVSDGNTEGKDLLHLELNGLLELGNLGGHGLFVLEETRELTSLVEARTKNTWDLLDQRWRAQEGIELGGEVLHELLVLVKLLQVFDRLEWDAFGLASINVLGISQDADLHEWSWDEWEHNGTRETLVLCRVVPLEHDLELNGFVELPGLLRLHDLLDARFVVFTGDFRHL